MSKCKTESPEQRQLTMPFVRVAGKGKTLGRIPSQSSGPSHARRPELSKHHPVHINIKLRDGSPSLREAKTWRLLASVLRAANAKGRLRVVHFSVQSNHVHLICEAADKQSLARGMQGLKGSMARRLNTLWGRSGTVFSERYHRTDLTSPRQVRNAIRYVLQNLLRHSSARRPSSQPQSGGRTTGAPAPDAYSSARWFAGWKEASLQAWAQAPDDAPVRSPRTWLLNRGWWKHHGLLSVAEYPTAVA